MSAELPISSLASIGTPFMMSFLSSPYLPCRAKENKERTSEILKSIRGTKALGIFGFKLTALGDESESTSCWFANETCWLEGVSAMSRRADGIASVNPIALV